MNAIKMKQELGLQPLHFVLVYLVTFMSLVISFSEVWEEQEVAQRRVVLWKFCQLWRQSEELKLLFPLRKEQL